jgi:large subunit ribosomal protein L21
MTDPTDPTTDPEDAADAAADEPETAIEPETATEPVAEAAEPETVEPEALEPMAAEPETGEPLVATATEPEAAPQRRPRVPRGPRPYAVIETGGKQYRVSVGDTISVEKLDGEAGADITIDRVLLLGGDGATRVGTPVVSGATVTARINEQYRGAKIVVFKYKPKKRYRKKMGHRQSLTRLEITAINQ